MISTHGYMCCSEVSHRTQQTRKETSYPPPAWQIQSCGVDSSLQVNAGSNNRNGKHSRNLLQDEGVPQLGIRTVLWMKEAARKE